MTAARVFRVYACLSDERVRRAAAHRVVRDDSCRQSVLHRVDLRSPRFVGHCDSRRLGPVSAVCFDLSQRLQYRHAPLQHHHGLTTGAALGRPCWGRWRGGAYGSQVQHLQHADGTRAVAVQVAEAS